MKLMSRKFFTQALEIFLEDGVKNHSSLEERTDIR